MNANKIYPIVLLVGLLFALIIWRKLWPTQSANAIANQISPKSNARMNRIQKVSKYFRLILQYGIPVWVILDLTFSEFVINYGIKMPFFSRQASEAHAHDSSMIFPIYGVLLLIIFLFWYRTILKLFGFFEKGVLFTAETVRCIQLLGGIYIARFFLALAFKFLLPDDESVGAGLHNNLFIGFFMIFIGWLIDEARKIREEQELTV
jgi:hypothetical protein